MFEAVLSIITMGIIAAIYRVGRRHQTPAPEDAASIEVFRADAQVANQALDMLCDGGVAAWIESCDDRQVAIHVEEDDIPMVRQVLQESGLQHA